MRPSPSGSVLWRRSGFTLIEVLLATGLFFTAVTFFTAAYLNTLRALDSLEVNQGFEQDMALIRQQALSAAKLEDLEAGGQVVTGQHGIATWSGEVEGTEVADLFRLTLKVELQAPGSETVQVETQELYLTRPSWSDPTEREVLRAETRDRLVARQTNLSGKERR